MAEKFGLLADGGDEVMMEPEHPLLGDREEQHDIQEATFDSAKAEAAAGTDDDEIAPALSFPVVALGASAGGLEAIRLVLRGLPLDSGMAFVFIQHLSPQHVSQLPSLLAQVTSMPVKEVTQGTRIEPNKVFIIPPNKLMSIAGGVLELAPRPEGKGVPMPINHFFRSLAQDQKSGSIGVVLSGTDSDGALGLQAIREEGGITIAQNEASAKFPGMPHNAASAGPIDLILPPNEIALELARIGHEAQRPSKIPALRVDRDAGEPIDEKHLEAILMLLRKATDMDFQGYKRPTIHRRIERRMILHRHANLDDYTALLSSDSAEALGLSEDILINVTSFFRDPDTFQALKNELLLKLTENRRTSTPLRIWVPGCSSGEEPYSIAICLIESMAHLASRPQIQLFGTDVSERVLALARAGVYQENQLAELSDERRSQFFTRRPNGFQIIKSIREMCVFARHNICVDPPFSRLDLISCRNMLIYLGPVLQRQVIATLHYALQPEGYLMLGRSESLRGFQKLFSTVNKQHKFFQRTGGSQPSSETVGRGFAKDRAEALEPVAASWSRRTNNLDFERASERIILREYGPAWVLVNERFEIVHSRGDTTPFLQLPTGAPSFDLLKMMRESLRGDMQKLFKRFSDEGYATQSSTVREVGGRGIQRTNIEIRRVPGPDSESPHFLVIFSPPVAAGEAEISGPEGRPGEIELLREELTITSQRLQAIIDERDAANQDLTAANEEIQSSNEELQSINEELETAKEELQSSNEELSTLNEELQNRNGELSQIGDDLSNLMSSTTIPILLLDNELRIRRMTPVAENVLGIRPSDLGRPVGDIRMRLSVDDMESLARNVLLTIAPREIELQDREGNWRELRLRPYCTADGRIGGVIMVFIDIDQIRRANEEAKRARQFSESIVAAVQTPLLVLRRDLRIRLANEAFYSDYGANRSEIENQSFLEWRRGQWDLPGMRAALEGVLSGREIAAEIEFDVELAAGHKRNVCIHVRAVPLGDETPILIAIEDITPQKSAAKILEARQEQLKSRVEEGTVALRETESALLRSRGELRELAASLLNAQEAERRRISRELHDDLSQKVAKLQFDIETLEQKLPVAEVANAKEALLSIRDQTGALAEDLRRVAHALHPSSLDHLGLTVALRSYAEEFSRSTGIALTFTSQETPLEIPIEVSSCVYRIVQEGLRNIAKHAPMAAVEIALDGDEETLCLSIRDDGDGFDPTIVRERRGLGLISMQERVRLVQGRFTLKAAPGQGVHIAIQIPVPPQKESA